MEGGGRRQSKDSTAKTPIEVFDCLVHLPPSYDSVPKDAGKDKMFQYENNILNIY